MSPTLHTSGKTIRRAESEHLLSPFCEELNRLCWDESFWGVVVMEDEAFSLNSLWLFVSRNVTGRGGGWAAHPAKAGITVADGRLKWDEFGAEDLVNYKMSVTITAGRSLLVFLSEPHRRSSSSRHQRRRQRRQRHHSLITQQQLRRRQLNSTSLRW